MLLKFPISKSPEFYQAWPDIALTKSGKLVCVFSECTHHGNRDYTRIMMTTSTDRGRTWSNATPITESTRGLDYYYNCARIVQLKDGRLCMLVDKCPAGSEKTGAEHSQTFLYFSEDDGASWSEPMPTPLMGIVPDKLLELDCGRWIISAHYPEDGYLTQFLHYSDDHGKTWSKQITVGKQEGLNLCEVSILPVNDKTLVAFMRENSGKGWDCKKTISNDNGETWGEIIDFPLNGCHRPVSGKLQDGRILITYRYMQGGKGWLGSWTQNLFAALTNDESVLAQARNESSARILPIDFDRSSKSDTGYSGWVQFDDGEIYIVNYIVDDHMDKGQIRGYSVQLSDFLL